MDMNECNNQQDPAADTTIRIRVEPELASLVPKFLDNRHKDVMSIRRALSNNDFESLAILGHSMKGCGGGYGFHEVTLIGAAIEEASKHRDAVTIENQANALSLYLSRLEIV
jgi:histidine phosphotransfer protein HptB